MLDDTFEAASHDSLAETLQSAVGIPNVNEKAFLAASEKVLKEYPSSVPLWAIVLNFSISRFNQKKKDNKSITFKLFEKDVIVPSNYTLEEDDRRAADEEALRTSNLCSRAFSICCHYTIAVQIWGFVCENLSLSQAYSWLQRICDSLKFDRRSSSFFFLLVRFQSRVYNATLLAQNLTTGFMPDPSIEDGNNTQPAMTANDNEFNHLRELSPEYRVDIATVRMSYTHWLCTASSDSASTWVAFSHYEKFFSSEGLIQGSYSDWEAVSSAISIKGAMLRASANLAETTLSPSKITQANQKDEKKKYDAWMTLISYETANPLRLSSDYFFERCKFFFRQGLLFLSKHAPLWIEYFRWLFAYGKQQEALDVLEEGIIHLPQDESIPLVLSSICERTSNPAKGLAVLLSRLQILSPKQDSSSSNDVRFESSAEVLFYHLLLLTSRIESRQASRKLLLSLLQEKPLRVGITPRLLAVYITHAEMRNGESNMKGESTEKELLTFSKRLRHLFDILETIWPHCVTLYLTRARFFFSLGYFAEGVRSFLHGASQLSMLDRWRDGKCREDEIEGFFKQYPKQCGCCGLFSVKGLKDSGVKEGTAVSSLPESVIWNAAMRDKIEQDWNLQFEKADYAQWGALKTESELREWVRTHLVIDANLELYKNELFSQENYRLMDGRERGERGEERRGEEKRGEKEGAYFDETGDVLLYQSKKKKKNNKEWSNDMEEEGEEEMEERGGKGQENRGDRGEREEKHSGKKALGESIVKPNIIELTEIETRHQQHNNGPLANHWIHSWSETPTTDIGLPISCLSLPASTVVILKNLENQGILPANDICERNAVIAQTTLQLLFNSPFIV